MVSGRVSSRAGRVARDFELARDGTLALFRSRSGVRVRVRSGTLVLTQAGDPEDHVLGVGDEVTLPPGGLVVAWALTPAAFAVRDAARVEVAEALARVSARRPAGRPRAGPGRISSGAARRALG
jgi:hypothetical protein